MGCSCKPLFPASSINSFPIEGFHPVPIDFGEVSKLSQVEQTRVGTHFECIRETRCVPAFDRRSGDAKPFSAHALGMPPSAGIVKEPVTAVVINPLTYPNWELIGPAVVIRRRPKRM
jgi:hypothetical protein